MTADLRPDQAAAALHRLALRVGDAPPPATGPDEKVGVFRGLSFAQYCALPGVNHSTLERVRRSPAHARQEALHPKEPTQALALGHAFHVHLLEPHRFPLEYVVGPTINRRTKIGRTAWARFEMENAGRFVLAPGEAALYERMSAAVLEHPVAGELLRSRGAAELAFVWRDPETALLCKGRVDRLAELGGWPFVLDLKSTRDASEKAFSADLARYGYARQIAFYREGLNVLRPTPRRAAIIAVEKEPPFAVAVYELAERALEQGEREFRASLRRYRGCLETGIWPGYSDELGLIDYPSWAVDRMD
jgi:exodeoxyribonuclease VIII